MHFLFLSLVLILTPPSISAQPYSNTPITVNVLATAFPSIVTNANNVYIANEANIAVFDTYGNITKTIETPYRISSFDSFNGDAVTLHTLEKKMIITYSNGSSLSVDVRNYTYILAINRYESSIATICLRWSGGSSVVIYDFHGSMISHYDVDQFIAFVTIDDHGYLVMQSTPGAPGDFIQIYVASSSGVFFSYNTTLANMSSGIAVNDSMVIFGTDCEVLTLDLQTRKQTPLISAPSDRWVLYPNYFNQYVTYVLLPLNLSGWFTIEFDNGNNRYSVSDYTVMREYPWYDFAQDGTLIVSGGGVVRMWKPV